MFRIFARCAASLVGEMDDITILPIGEVQDLDVAFVGQVSTDSFDLSLERLLTVHKARIDRELAAFEPFIEQ
ncbi:hypothetical protein U716_12120 [Rhodobacter capsulatus B6]|nr:hypothetical protein U716_12120 [Rhodobacter capsulatus B6]